MESGLVRYKWLRSKIGLTSHNHLYLQKRNTYCFKLHFLEVVAAVEAAAVVVLKMVVRSVLVVALVVVAAVAAMVVYSVHSKCVRYIYETNTIVFTSSSLAND